MSRKLLKQWLPTRNKAKELKYLQSFRHVLERPEIWSLTRYSVAKACAIGMFVGLLPLMSAQMVISGTIAIFFRANLLISVAVVWITNPITAAPIYYFCYRVGLIILSMQPMDLGHPWTLSSLLHQASRIWLPLCVGSFVVAVIGAIISYYAVLLFWRVSVSLRWANRKRKKSSHSTK
jgi:uncharacterized protein (DUF2062 family)